MKICNTPAHSKRGGLFFVKLSGLSSSEKAAGVIAMSAGNHVQGVAYAAQRLEIPATIVMPLTTPFVKVQRTREFGADVVLEGLTLADAAAHAQQIADTQGLSFIYPCGDPYIIGLNYRRGDCSRAGKRPSGLPH